MDRLRRLWQRLVGPRGDENEPLWPILLSVARKPAAWGEPQGERDGTDQPNEGT